MCFAGAVDAQFVDPCPGTPVGYVIAYFNGIKNTFADAQASVDYLHWNVIPDPYNEQPVDRKSVV